MRNEVRDCRTALGWSTTKLAAEAEVTEGTIRNIEAQKGVSGTTQMRVAQALGKKVEEVFFLEEEGAAK